MEPQDAPLVASPPLESPKKPVAAEDSKPFAKYHSAYDDKLKQRAKKEPIAKNRQLTIEQRFEAVANLLRNSGLALSITVHMTEETAMQTMPFKFDLQREDPLHLFYDLKDLEMGDVLGLALVNDWLYYYPRAAPNIYEDPMKRKEHAKLREENEAATLAFAHKNRKNLPARLAILENWMLKMKGYDANLERADRAIRELLKLNKTEENDRDLVIALRDEVKDIREIFNKVPGLITRVDTISERVDSLMDAVGQVGKP
jgi:hypothetical protein